MFGASSRPFNPHDWSKAGCQNRRFMLPGIACAVTGGCSHRKELFFYGAGYGDYFKVCHAFGSLPNPSDPFGFLVTIGSLWIPSGPFRSVLIPTHANSSFLIPIYFKVGMAALHGPELPLELFAKDERRPPRFKPRDWDYYRVKRMEQFCTNPKYTHLPEGRMHPSCCVAKASWPKRWGCRWHEVRGGDREQIPCLLFHGRQPRPPSLAASRAARQRPSRPQLSASLPSRAQTLRLRFGRATSTWLQTGMPWVKPDECVAAT